MERDTASRRPSRNDVHRRTRLGLDVTRSVIPTVPKAWRDSHRNLIETSGCRHRRWKIAAHADPCCRAYTGNSPDSIRILSIDGGGVRGIVPAVVLGEIQRRTGRHPSELFDVIAGTSTGSLLAMSMCIPGPDGRPRYQASLAADAYEEFAPKIFPRERWMEVRGLVREKYSAAGLEKALHDPRRHAILRRAGPHARSDL